jgi:hypothetical protein
MEDYACGTYDLVNLLPKCPVRALWNLNLRVINIPLTVINYIVLNLFSDARGGYFINTV